MKKQCRLHGKITPFWFCLRSLIHTFPCKYPHRRCLGFGASYKSCSAFKPMQSLQNCKALLRIRKNGERKIRDILSCRTSHPLLPAIRVLKCPWVYILWTVLIYISPIGYLPALPCEDLGKHTLKSQRCYSQAKACFDAQSEMQSSVRLAQIISQ